MSLGSEKTIVNPLFTINEMFSVNRAKIKTVNLYLFSLSDKNHSLVSHINIENFKLKFI